MSKNHETDYQVKAKNFLYGLPGRELTVIAAALAVLGGAKHLRIEPQATPDAGFDVHVTPKMRRRCRKLLRKARALFRDMRRQG